MRNNNHQKKSNMYENYDIEYRDMYLRPMLLEVICPPLKTRYINSAALPEAVNVRYVYSMDELGYLLGE